MAIADIAIGLLIGSVLGVINEFVLRFGVRSALKCGQRARATLIIIGSYAIRYVLIAAVIYVILIKSNLTVAIVTLGVLGVLTIVLASIKRGNGRDDCGAGA